MKFIKKIVAPAMALTIALSSVASTAYAVTPSINISMPNISGIKFDFSNLNIQIPNEYLPNINGSDINIGGSETTTPDKDEVIEFETEFENTLLGPTIQAPVISSVKYSHASRYVRAHLEVKWNAIENAKSYEVLITKGNGETITYTTTTNSLYKNCDCPRVYNEKTSTWESSTVKVRAIVSDDPCGKSAWSEPVTFGCNQLHSM